MDGKGRSLDNVAVEHLWRNVKYEAAYPKAYEDTDLARASLARCLSDYNSERRHQSLDRRSSDDVY